jgi:penicillin-binding protein 2
VRINKLIPSMYQRRLLLLGALFLLIMLAPAARVAQLSIAKGEVSLANAEKKLVTESWLPTTRGRVIDRNGRVLAFDRATFDIAFDYSVIRGDWMYKQAARKAKRLYRDDWPKLSPEERDQRIESCKPEFRDRVDRMWDRVCQIAGVSRADLDSQLVEIRKQVDLLAVNVTEANRRIRIARIKKEIEELAKEQGEAAAAVIRGAEQIAELENADIRRPIVEETIPQVVLRGVSENVGYAFKRIAEEDAKSVAAGELPTFPGLKVLDSGRREYPLETMQVQIDRNVFPGKLKTDIPATVTVSGVATHILGWMRHQVQADDETGRKARRELRGETGIDRGRYFAGDSVGAWGIEAGAEDSLRGLRGLQTRHLDSGEIETLPASPGGDIQLTIDAQLQARLHALFNPNLGLAIVQDWHKPLPNPNAEPSPFAELPDRTPLNGAITVIDVATGDILALVSHPTFDRATLQNNPTSIWKDELNAPYLNRATNKSYQPGSIVKPLMLASAATMGKLGLTETIDCRGHYFPDKPLLYRCWIYKQSNNSNSHGPLDGAEAIQRSCNIFFFELGNRLTPRGISEWYHRFGVDLPRADGWNLGIGDEFPGTVKDPAKAELNEAVLMAIGQGPIAWTPLHAADAYATLGRGGTRIVPRLRTDLPIRRQDLALDRSAVALALEGLRASAEKEGGTTHRVYFIMPDGERIGQKLWNAPGITVWAKSGTADVAPFKADLNSTGDLQQFDGDHAWCVFLCGDKETPRYAVSVVIDHGGSGGKVAGPLANQVIHALIAEGYLPKVNPETN